MWAAFVLLAATVFASVHAANMNASVIMYDVNTVDNATKTQIGTLQFVQVNGTLTISGMLTGNFTAGSLHGFHIHQNKAITNQCLDAGAHYNPLNVSHAGPDNDINHRHIGDFGNVIANDTTMIMVQISDKIAQLDGKYPVMGLAVVLHEDFDDLGKGTFDDSLTTGHAGKRIACGLIKSSATMSSWFAIASAFVASLLLARH